ncbi:hypothetical protein GGR54DRAFT_98766 [Hypoxylon sp. NC1633]|nr:hypothetical protein GGR54DRAFT_98766 [Hypoxylon sp. NC1633]
MLLVGRMTISEFLRLILKFAAFPLFYCLRPTAACGIHQQLISILSISRISFLDSDDIKGIDSGGSSCEGWHRISQLQDRRPSPIPAEPKVHLIWHQIRRILEPRHRTQKSYSLNHPCKRLDQMRITDLGILPPHGITRSPTATHSTCIWLTLENLSKTRSSGATEGHNGLCPLPRTDLDKGRAHRLVDSYRHKMSALPCQPAPSWWQFLNWAYDPINGFQEHDPTKCA